MIVLVSLGRLEKSFPVDPAYSTGTDFVRHAIGCRRCDCNGILAGRLIETFQDSHVKIVIPTKVGMLGFQFKPE